MTTPIAAPESEAPTVFYIAGEGRSGSTIVDRCLGTIEDAASFNEMHEIVNQYLLNRKACSCGELPQDCPFWTSVLKPLAEIYDLAEMQKLHHKLDGSAQFFKILFGLYATSTKEELAKYGAFTRDLYTRIAKEAGVRVIIDSSKNPTRAIFLKRHAGLDVYCLHLIRDPNSVIASWSTQKASNQDQLPIYSTGHSAVRWIAKNLMCDFIRFVAPFRRLRYEVFCEAPRKHIEALRDLVPAVKGSATGFVTDDTVNLGLMHSLQGNPDRFSSGATTIKKAKPKKSAGFSAWTALCRVVALRYGYSLRS